MNYARIASSWWTSLWTVSSCSNCWIIIKTDKTFYCVPHLLVFLICHFALRRAVEWGGWGGVERQNLTPHPNKYGFPLKGIFSNFVGRWGIKCMSWLHLAAEIIFCLKLFDEVREVEAQTPPGLINSNTHLVIPVINLNYSINKYTMT